MWICARCNKEFRNANQSHSCYVSKVDEHFANKPEVLRLTYDKLVKQLEEFAEYTLNPVKNTILFKTLTSFMAVKVKKDHLVVEYFLNHTNDAFPVFKVVKVSRNRVVHFISLSSPDDVDNY